MSKNLVIVESPAKAKTIEKYLGKDFTVLSSVGHIRNIAKKTADGKPPIDTKSGFKTVYEVDSDKKKIIAQLKKAIKQADTVWLATDEDREGEAIAWHLCEVLKLNPKTTKRIVFHEITKTAIEEAVKNPRTVDMSLVEAQQARQILDRLVGFELSPVIWRKVPGGKSAGRVQSPAVRLLVEREREIANHKSSSKYKISAIFKSPKSNFKAELDKDSISQSQAESIIANLIKAKFYVKDITKSPASRNPSAPFTTSTLQQAANNQLGFGAKSTMSAAQKLYQDGHITYMRTDSVNLSKQALAQIAKHIEKNFGSEYSQVRNFKTKNSSAQEAHEAIRPTNINLAKAGKDKYQQKVYDLILRRTLASQMSPAKIEKTVITVDVDTLKPDFIAKGEVIVFDGFLKVYSNQKEAKLPDLNIKDKLDLKMAEARQVFNRPPARYSEGSLVKKLEELGIGRPSTYATIINTIQQRGYVKKGDSEGEERQVNVIKLENSKIERSIETEKTGSNKGKLVPTNIGELSSDFLRDYFSDYVDYGFTADVEQDFDKIASGDLKRNQMLEEFYQPFHKLIDKSDNIDRKKVAKIRQIGQDPKTKQPILARFGKFGPMLQLGDGEDDNKPRFAPMPTGKTIETVKLEDALKAFELPRIVGQTAEGKDIKANIGRFGPYIQVDKLFISIKPLDPHEITLKQALKLYDDKLKQEAAKNIHDFGEGFKVLNGRFGPYITDGKKNVKIPKDIKPESLTKETALKIFNAPKKSKQKK